MEKLILKIYIQPLQNILDRIFVFDETVRKYLRRLISFIC